MRLTRSESFTLDRRRRGLSQSEEAALRGVQRHAYENLEAGHPEHATTLPIKTPKVSDVKPYERCFLFRRRQHMTQAQLAKAVGMSRVWVVAMEDGTADISPLTWYWAKQHDHTTGP